MRNHYRPWAASFTFAIAGFFMMSCDGREQTVTLNEPSLVGTDDGKATASTQTITVALGPKGCGPNCFGVDIPEGNTSTWYVQVITSNGAPTSTAKTYRIFTSDFNPGIVQPLCTHGSGIANAGSDYTALDVTHTIPVGTPNGTRYFYNVPTTNDSFVESNEQFVANLSPGGWECAAIINND